MKPVAKILYRVIGVTFYERNAAFFLFLFVLLFGVVHGSELWYYHFSLAYAISDSAVFMGMVFLVWLIYNLKCIQFVMKALEEPRHSFLHVIGCLSRCDQLLALLRMQFFLFMPVLVYSMFVMGVAIYSSNDLAAFFIAAYNLMLCFLSALLYRKKITHPDSTKAIPSIFFAKFRLRKNYPLIFISWLLNESKMIFLVTKFFSLFLLIVFLNGYFIDVKDLRIPFLGMLAAVVAHCVMVFELRRFEETQLLFTRNFPVSRLKRFSWIAAVYSLILIPEMIVLASSIPAIISFPDFILLSAFGIGLLILFHCLLYLLKAEMKTFLEVMSALCAILFFLILYSQFIAIVIAILIASMLVFFTRYFKYESEISDA